MSAQKSCATTEVQEKLEASNPAIKKARLDAEAKLLALGAKNYLEKNRKKTGKSSSTIYEIPVIVHVIVPANAPLGTDFNKTDAEIATWIENANKMFAATYNFPTYPGHPDANTSAPIRIKLVLAKRDEQCNATTGIKRYDGSTISGYNAYGVQRNGTSGATAGQIRNLAKHWPESSYFNIYIVNKVDGNETPYGTAGWAGYPTNPDSSYDSFMKSALISHEDDATLVHEMGHAFSLYHTFDGVSSQGGQCTPTVNSSDIDHPISIQSDQVISV